MNKPMRKVAAVLAVLFLALFVNLNVVQVVQGSSYRDNQANARVLLNEYSSPRGQIVVQGNAVAESVATHDELKYLRKYSDGPVYASATGFYSFVYGATRIEQTENSILSGDSSQLFTTKLAGLLTGRNPRGGSVQLTLNAKAQQAAYAAMKGSNGQMRRGAVVALDPRTGAILALVSTPSYDPNRLAGHDSAKIIKAYDSYTADQANPLLNRAVSQIYPPGSIFKIIDSAAALKLNIMPATRIAATNTYWPLDPKRTSSCPTSLAAPCIQNFAGETCDNGKTATLEFAFAKSCNTAFAQLVVDNVGATSLADEARQFGLDPPYSGNPPDFCNPPAFSVPLPVCHSTIGSTADLSDRAALAQTAFGQRDVRVSPLQGAMLSAAVANNGTLMKPYLVQSELRPNLSVLQSTQPQQLSSVLDPNTDQNLIAMMKAVVTSPEGTGASANITDLGPSVQVGGKTGTADVGVTSAANVQPDAWFTGFALVDQQPRIAVAVVIENGGVTGDESAGGKAAGPVAKKVMEAYLRSVGVG